VLLVRQLAFQVTRLFFWQRQQAGPPGRALVNGYKVMALKPSLAWLPIARFKGHINSENKFTLHFTWFIH